MTMIQLIACIGMIAGLFMVLGISPAEMSDSIFSRLTAAPGSIRADINETTKRKKAGFFRREITEAQAVLAASGREGKFPMVCMASLVLFALGACIAILAGNAFLVPVLAVGFMLAPFWYVKLTAGSFKKDVAAELETALSVITTAYLRTENFQQAVEENVRYLHHPVQEVFQRFLTRIKHIDPDMDAALHDLKYAIGNEVWQEWCEAVMACQTDRSLKSQQAVGYASGQRRAGKSGFRPPQGVRHHGDPGADQYPAGAVHQHRLVPHPGGHHPRPDGHRRLHRSRIRVLCLCGEADPAY